MQTLLPLAAEIGARLKSRGETVAVAESSTGGLVAAALLAQPGASGFMRGGGVIYTRQARAGLLEIQPEDLAGFRASTERYATLLATTIRARLSADWGLGESGAAGPTGNSYGDAAGHACLAVAGPRAAVFTLETGDPDREANMRAFARRLLEMFLAELEAA
jgi:PncC family amidohydrolase